MTSPSSSVWPVPDVIGEVADRTGHTEEPTVGEAALDLHRVVGFPPSVSARMAAVGLGVVGFAVVMDAEVAS